MELQQTQEALNAALGERDELKIAYETAAAQISDIQNLTEGLKVVEVGIRVCDANGNVVKEYDSLSEANPADLKNGESFVIVLYNAAGEIISEYDLNNVPEAPEAPAAEAAPEAPEAPAAEAAPETPEAPAEEAPAEEPAA